MSLPLRRQAVATPGGRRAEAAPRQDAVFEMHDALFANQGRLEYPHLWIRAERLALDVERFDGERRSDAARHRVQDDFWGLG